MEDAALQRFGSILKDMREVLVTESTRAVGNECPRGDDADVTHNQMSNRLATELAARNQAHIRRIDAALKRIRDRTYGHCAECEEPIDERRLQSRPITTLCALCKEEEERTQAIYGTIRRKTA